MICNGLTENFDVRSRGPGEWVWRVEKALQGRRPWAPPWLRKRRRRREVYSGGGGLEYVLSLDQRERERERLYQETVSLNQ